MGGKEQNQAAIIIDLSDTAAGLSFDVMVNNSRYTTVNGGSSNVISLRPFETYTINLKNRSAEFIYLDDQEYTVTLYPGNVIPLSWQAKRIDIVFGRLVDQYQNPVRNALITGVSGLATTDEFGIFQAEIEQGTRNITVQTRELSCIAELPAYQTQQGVASVGVIACNLKRK